MNKWPYCTSTWKRLRLVKLDESPLCFACQQRGQVVEATTVDHIKPISQGGDPFPELSGLMSLCERCHNEKTSGFDRTKGNATGRRFKGCDANGNPIDPADGWWGHS
ncbi:HNH endonuclease [Epibacterium sp. MM17-32]|uniref:HNH endonuclease n=1 Tax=Epibacterium sp. MM17-32 TaxID=2917734 RepID=UPI001EF6B8BB|nr:HNH endonuclease signature motif containing protein [Epibacterium sp. MM17-32]MCG7630665.1 HNH endonuclease [Epibacterium sp. MM17-32]